MNTIEFGDCRAIMRRWASEKVKVQMCVTSPPYFNLRDYGHEGQIGLEQTPEEYIKAMVDVFCCVRDVLADDGTLWLNIGDSYAGGSKAGEKRPGSGRADGIVDDRGQRNRNGVGLVQGCKPKDLIGIPWMLAFALRADGWYLRQDIIWHKPNPMPESVQDRCTKSHEYIFLLSKTERYHFDSKAMQEDTAAGATRNRRSVWSVPTRPYKGAHFATFPPALIEPCVQAGSREGDIVLDPFMGSGTTAEVALRHGRRFLGCELNPEYKQLQDERIESAKTLFTQ
jgi:DNA modification methylase